MTRSGQTNGQTSTGELLDNVVEPGRQLLAIGIRSYEYEYTNASPGQKSTGYRLSFVRNLFHRNKIKSIYF